MLIYTDAARKYNVRVKREFNDFLERVCGYQTDFQDWECMNDIGNTFKTYSLSPELQERVDYWTRK